MHPTIERRESSPRISPILSRWADVAAYVLGFQLLRVFLPLSTFHLFDAHRLSPVLLLPVGLLATAGGFLRLRASFPTSRRLVWCTIGTARVVELVIDGPLPDLVVSGLGVFALSLLLTSPEGDDPVVLPTALGLDAAIFGACGTVEPSWVPHPGWSLLGLFLPVALVAVAAARPAHASEPGPSGGAVWLGPWLFLHLTLVSSPAAIASRSGLPLPIAASVVAVGAALALLAAEHLHAPLPALLLLALGLLALGRSGPIAAVGAALAAVSLAALLRRLRPAAGSAWWGALGPWLLVLLLFLRYATYDLDLGFEGSAIPVLAAGLLALGGLRTAEIAPFSRPVAQLAVRVLLLGAIALSISAIQPAAPPSAATDSVRVATFNLHQGFAPDGGPTPEALALAIEATGADVIALQEVSRGWAVNGSLDLYAWLARRLGLAGAFGPTADRQWGNAVFSRHPIRSARTMRLPPDLPLDRGLLDVTIDLGETDLRILATHLHHRPEQPEIRLIEVESILTRWAGTPRTILLGDLNDDPGSAILRRLLGRGFVDAGARLDPKSALTLPAKRNEPPRRIDYILATDDLALEDPEVLPDDASDHRPFAVTIRLGAG